MVKKLLIVSVLLYTSLSFSSVYEKNCIKCHQHLPVSIDKFFYRYLLKYSSKTKVKEAMKDFLKNPKISQTIMPDAFINRFGIKNKTTLLDSELDDALNKYWQKYKVFGKLK